MEKKNILEESYREDLKRMMRIAGVPSERAEKIVQAEYKAALVEQGTNFKESVIEHLEEVVAAIWDNNTDKLKGMIAYSPAGDDMGCDNYYISFKDVCGCEDIGEVIELLEEMQP